MGGGGGETIGGRGCCERMHRNGSGDPLYIRRKAREIELGANGLTLAMGSL